MTGFSVHGGLSVLQGAKLAFNWVFGMIGKWVGFRFQPTHLDQLVFWPPLPIDNLPGSLLTIYRRVSDQFTGKAGDAS